MGKKSRHHFDHSHFLVPTNGDFRLQDRDPAFTEGIKNKHAAREALIDDVRRLASSQELLWATGTHSVLVILQALDAAGKDGAIKHVMSGVNPQGVDVTSFKAPNDEELTHHFLWRPMRKLPARGRIAIFNRSYYEEVLVVRVHPSFLDAQVIPSRLKDAPLEDLWKSRFDEINAFEHHLHLQDITVIKIFLNVSKEEQRKRFLGRLEDPSKLFKFSARDVAEREHWEEYQHAYEQMLRATSTPHAPWYVVPADKKWFARAAVADIISSRIAALDLKLPEPSATQLAEVAKYREILGD
ncbi:MAG: polyphosphate kinase 2 family protein [Akkermansiaceae bacterium]|jgi:PPK2 family polyphosphate:nucleotide phosphotransferase|nr:polyphosphate kinase 2 family protein [Akkermansiaceae bacterium]